MNISKDMVLAVVGVSRDHSKYGYRVWHSLRASGYQVIPVNPQTEFIDGVRCFKSLTEIRQHVDAVVCVVPPLVSEQVVEECGRLGIQRIWMQPGSESITAVTRAHELGIEVAAQSCLIVDVLREKLL